MRYYLELSLKYLGKHWSRTVYTIFGILLTFMLVFAALTTGYSIWECSLELAYSGEQGRTQLGLVDSCSVADIEKVRRYVSVSEVVVWDEEDYNPVSLDELEEDRSYSVFIGLKDTSNLRKSAEELQQNLGKEVYVDEEIEMYLNQGDSLERGLYNSMVVILGAVFALFSIMILRNIMMISVVERMQDYGLMRCVGMSQKQIYILLVVEGMVMGICGAVGGIGCGYGILQMVAAWLNPKLDMPVTFHFGLYPKAVFFTTIFCLASVFYSLLEPARQAGMISPIEALHNNITLKNRRGGLREKIHYRSGRLWGRIFGAPGEYAYKNMMRSRGRLVYLFVGMLVCMALMGSVYSFSDSFFATVEKAYQGEHMEFAEVISVDAGYSDELYHKICSELREIDGVLETGRILERTEFEFFDSHLSEQEVNMCCQYALDEAHFEKLKPYLIDGEISFEKMKQENGVILCDSIYNVRDEEGNFTNQRITDYKVGDTISFLCPEGHTKAYDIFNKSVKRAAKNKGIQTISARDNEDEYEITPSMFSDEQPGFQKLLKETVRLIEKKGYDWGGRQKLSEYTAMYQVEDDLKELLFQQGNRDDYVIQGIVSEDIFYGGDDSYGSKDIKLLQPDTTVLADPSWIGGERYGYFWCIGLNRDVEKLDDSIEQYCRKKSTEQCSFYYESRAEQYLDTLSTLEITKGVAALVGGSIALISLIQIFNTVCASMFLRRKELWLYEVVGMSRRQERRMIVLENSVAAFLAVVVGCLMARGISWYFVDYLLNQDESIRYVFSVWKNIALAVALFALAVAASLLGRRFACKGRR